MCASARFLGASTPFGVITHVSPRLFNPEATVRAKDGSTKTYRLPFLIAHGLKVKA